MTPLCQDYQDPAGRGRDCGSRRRHCVLSRESCRDWKRQRRQRRSCRARQRSETRSSLLRRILAGRELRSRIRAYVLASRLGPCYSARTKAIGKIRLGTSVMTAISISSEMLRLFHVLRLKRERRDAVLMAQLPPWLTQRDSRQSEVSVVDDRRLSGQRCRVYIRAPSDSHDV